MALMLVRPVQMRKNHREKDESVRKEMSTQVKTVFYRYAKEFSDPNERIALVCAYLK